MFHYDGQQPPHSHATPYGSYVDDANPAHAAFAADHAADTLADGDRDTDGERDAEADSADSAAASDPSNRPPASYMHEGFLHHVPEWMKKEAEQHSHSAEPHRGGNTAEDRLLAQRRRQDRIEQERQRESQKDPL